MSSVVRTTFALLLASVAMTPSIASAQDAADWDRSRATHAAQPASPMAQAVARWKLLTGSDRFLFDDYASFLLSYPGFPEETKLRSYAERALERESAPAARIAAFFDRYPAITNSARARQALALFELGRPEAVELGRAVWRAGPMNDLSEAALSARLAKVLTPADHDARMDALLWNNSSTQATRQLLLVSAQSRPSFLARLGLVNGQDPAAQGIDPGPSVLRDAGYLYNRVRMLRTAGKTSLAAAVLATRPPLAAPPRDARRWIGELLSVARNSDAATAVRIAAAIDETFPAGTDVSLQSFQIRDDYTSLMWLGGTRALNELRDPSRAAPLFYRYGAAARSPQTRSKGYYWAGRAMAQAGKMAEANRYFEMAAIYPEQYYGQLSLERLGRPLPAFNQQPRAVPTAAERTAFNSRPLTMAVREVARASDWPTGVRFFREISEQAITETDHVLVADLARELGRRDLAVILAQAAHTDGFGEFHKTGYPLIPVVAGSNWTMVHAITRQESQFAMNAMSHVGARGLMQLMPGTAREQAAKVGLEYNPDALIKDAAYNITLGDAYFRRMLEYYNGSYPLAVAAYNAGPGNVNKMLRANGDPRNGTIDWVEWVERIPFSETRSYVQHVLENAVVYEAMNPDKARMGGPNPLSRFLGKRTPG